MQSKQKDKKVRTFRMLVTGDNNYNNITKFNRTMDQFYNNIEDTKTIATFGGVYGAEVLAQIFAENYFMDFKTFTTGIFRNNKTNQQRLYHILLGIAVKWSDVVVIFSNIYTKKINQIIGLCKRHKKEYLLIKE